MAATIAVQESGGAKPSAPQTVHRVLVTADGSYPSGGYDFALPIGNAGENIVSVVIEPNEANTNAKFGRYDYAADKVVLIDAAGAEIAGAVDLTGETVIAHVFTV
jgi:hypothetical protein